MSAAAARRARARLRGVRIVVCLGLIAGIALSPRLWSSSRFFPSAPPFDVLGALVSPLDHVAVGLLLACLACSAAMVGAAPVYGALTAAALLALGDQTRWQPWFYQYVTMLVVMVAFGRREQEGRALNACRAIVAGIYLWSGLQKLNPVFMDVGLTAAVGDAILSDGARAWLVRVTPLVPFVEAAMGLGLLHPRTRTPAVLAVLAMHAAILLALGPLGRSWNSVVWPWNITMIVLVLLLFGRTPGARPAEILGLQSPRSRVQVLVTVLFWGMPALSIAGAWDAYLSAALYSQNLRHAAMKVSAAAAARLPQEVRRQIEPDSLLWLQDWSLAELNAPVYPERRVFKKIARALCERAGRAPDDLFLIVASKPDLLSGERTVEDFTCDQLR